MDPRIKQILKFIEENLKKDLALKALIDYCCLGRSRFCELFKKETGMTFKSYLKHKRIEKAKELLKDDSLNIKQISYKVGYRHIWNFNHDFKKTIKLSPLTSGERVNRKIHQKNRKKYQKKILDK